MELLGSIKVSLELFGQYVHPVKGTEDTKSFNTKAIPLTTPGEISKLVEAQEDIVKTKASEFEHHESGECYNDLR